MNWLLILLIATVPPTTPIPEGYVPLVDDTHRIVVAVPEQWNDVDTAPMLNDEGGTDIPRIVASPDIESFQMTFDTPGMAYLALPHTDDLLAVFDTYGLTAGCESIEVRDYDDPDFLGFIQIGLHCGPQDMTWNAVVANPVVQPEVPFTAMLQVQAVDPVWRRTVLLTFNVG
jgi:hypothetical protein